MFWFEPPDQRISWEFVASSVLDDNTIDQIHRYANDNPLLLQKAEIRNECNTEHNVETEYRRSDVMFLADTNHFAELYNKVIVAALEVNKIHYKYALNYIDPLQYSVYNSSNLGYYDIHCDSHLRNTSGFVRKLSFSILLDDPEDFEGGDFLLHTTSDPFKAPIKKGDMFLFPSYMPHSVTPVTKGTRRALVGWVCGPNFV